MSSRYSEAWRCLATATQDPWCFNKLSSLQSEIGLWRVNEPLAFIIIFHCIWHSCLLHGKDGICGGDSQISASSRAVKKRPWDVLVGPARYPVRHRATRRASEEETWNHHPASHWGEHGTIAAWHRTWCWIEERRLDVFRFYTNLEFEPSGMLTGSVTRLFSDDGDLRVSWWFDVRIFHPMQLGTFNVIRWPRLLRGEIFEHQRNYVPVGFEGSAGIVNAATATRISLMAKDKYSIYIYTY